ncbi:MAG: hypothetical protein KGV59_01565 [Tenacibaculum sp.]|nr:hypothetical protein [Tenacibaculum sp.]
MTLLFKAFFPGKTKEVIKKQTFFVEKIWECFLQKGIEMKAADFIRFFGRLIPRDYIINTYQPKLHTIRKDTKNKWKVGNDIEFKLDISNEFHPHAPYIQFAPIIKVKSIQKIKISEMIMTETKYSYVTKNKRIFKIEIDNHKLTKKQIEKLAINDGFDSVDDFFEWFNEDFTGKIIHWTDLKY